MSEIDQNQTLSSEFFRVYSWTKRSEENITALELLDLSKQFDNAAKLDSVQPLIIMNEPHEMVIVFRGLAVVFSEHNHQAGWLFDLTKELASRLANPSGESDIDNAANLLTNNIRTASSNVHQSYRLNCG